MIFSVLGNVHKPRIFARVGVTLGVLFAILMTTASTATAAVTYKWANSSITWVTGQELMPAAMLARGKSAPVTRRAFVQSLEALENYRAAQGGPEAQLPLVVTGTTLGDVEPDSLYAKAVYLGWITPIQGNFVGGAAITADEASKGIVGALGLRDSAIAFSLKLQENLPGLKTQFYYKAAQVYARAMGLRYNHLQGTEKLEVAPKEAMSVAHVAFMIHRASTLSPWKTENVRQFEEFDIPALGPNQKKMIHSGVKLIGWPYVWAGETEGKQAEGHGGFDCSGFVWRVVLRTRIPTRNRVTISGRTSMAMSGEIAKRKRIYKTVNLRPGDMLFFGHKGAASKPADNYHTGIYLGNDWFIHSTGSNDGVSISKLDGYWLEKFSWGRHVLKRR